MLVLTDTLPSSLRRGNFWETNENSFNFSTNAETKETPLRKQTQVMRQHDDLTGTFSSKSWGGNCLKTFNFLAKFEIQEF